MFVTAHASCFSRSQRVNHVTCMHTHDLGMRRTCLIYPTLQNASPSVLAVKSVVYGPCRVAGSTQHRHTVVVANAAAEAGETVQQTPDPSARFSQAELKQLWDSVSRALLKLGKGGASESHARSLSELLASHKLVKVQLNGAKDNPKLVERIAADIVQQTAGAAELLQAKGVTILFCNSSSSNEELMAVAEASSASTAVWKAKRAAAAAERRQQREVAEAKREANASRTRKRIGQMITTVAKPSKGPLDKTTLVDEWKQLAAGIAAEEAAEGSSQLPGGKRRAPWRK